MLTTVIATTGALNEPTAGKPRMATLLMRTMVTGCVGSAHWNETLPRHRMRAWGAMMHAAPTCVEMGRNSAQGLICSKGLF